MGLLDEAIRDHLELKRRSGADPGEIAREEQEALEPVFPDEPWPAALDEQPPGAVIGEAPAPGEPLAEAPTAAPNDEAPPQGDPLGEAATAHAGEGPQHAAAPPLSAIGEETAEWDVQSVMDQDAGLDDQPPAGRGAETAIEHAGAEEELLEWEMPSRSTEPPPEPLPGQERLTFE